MVTVEVLTVTIKVVTEKVEIVTLTVKVGYTYRIGRYSNSSGRLSKNRYYQSNSEFEKLNQSRDLPVT